MSKSRRAAVAETKLSESSESDFSEEEIVEKPKKKAAPKKKASEKKAPKKASAAEKVAAPPVEKKAPKKAAKKVATPPPEEVSDEEDAPAPQKKASAPRKGRKAPAAKEGQRSFQISLDSVEPAIDRSLLKEHDDIVHGTTPLQAGRKTFTRLLRKYKDTGVTEYKFVIVEITGTKKASFSYEGKRVEREEPRVIKKGDSEYSIKYDFVVKATKKPKAEESD
ncbi:hypothetical protein [Brazilian marseillevirus]|uniref:hypothetical protein n=1 Tax=Brazilian marseillevirus TaxID=1813599 RepID=UPI0007849773|nr:hypothetical protein A3303_gp265 [Brazilian marseillevirus]AMQ10773.1 hypothetical protein [Brazilian marseillevirus]